MNNWSNLLFLLLGIVFIVAITFSLHIFFKVYNIRDIIYAVYDERDPYENILIGSQYECESYISAQVDHPNYKYLHCTLYFGNKRRNKYDKSVIPKS
jgi:hypothetical protein